MSKMSQAKYSMWIVGFEIKGDCKMKSQIVIGHLLLKSVNQYPDKIAVIDGSREVTYKELLDKVTLAQHHLKHSVNADDTVMILLKNSIEFIIYYFALSMLGVRVLPTYYDYTTDEIHRLYEHSSSVMIVTDNYYDKELTNLNICTLNIEEVNLINSSTDMKSLNYILNTSKIGVLLHTSGTSSQPKLVTHTHQSIIENIKMHSESLGLTSEDRVLIAIPLAFGYCHTSQFLTHIYLGSTITIMGGLFIPNYFVNLLNDHKITITTLIPRMLNVLRERKATLLKLNDSPLKKICYGGSPLSKNELSVLLSILTNVDLIQTYGQTEAGPRITYKVMQKQDHSHNVGIPISNKIKLKIIGDKSENLPNGKIGKVFVQSPSLMKGYYQKEGLGTEGIIDGWLDTGDMGYLDQDNNLHLQGRISNMIKSLGFQFYPEEVETLLKSNFKEFNDILITSEQHSKYGLIPVLYIEALEEDKELKRNILKFCNDKLAHYKRPKKIYFVNKLERTLNGKIKR